MSNEMGHIVCGLAVGGEGGSGVHRVLAVQLMTHAPLFCSAFADQESGTSLRALSSASLEQLQYAPMYVHTYSR